MEHSENDGTSSNAETEWGKTFTENSPSRATTNQKESIPLVNNSQNTSSLPDSLIGETLGSGTVVEKLGEGGMGRVYKIENKDLDMYRAVKIMINTSDDTAIKRFQREAKILARLNHPSIVSIINFGTWKQNCFIEMEYIEGFSLDDILKQKKEPLDIITTLAIGIIVGKALKYAHLHKYELNNEKCTGLIHRDLKPGNIMISKSGDLKLLDFGIARPIGESVATLTTGIVGSWSYLPPEQLDGCAVDHRVDIYALGTVLYELVTGATAFPFDNIKQLLSIKTKGGYEPIKKVNPDIPDKIVSVIDKSLEVKPENRYKDIHEFTTDLQKLFSALTKETPEAVLAHFTEDKKIVTGNEKKLSKVETSSDKKLITFKSVIPIGIVIAVIFILLGLFVFRLTPREKSGSVLPLLLFPDNKSTVKDSSVLFQWKAISPKDVYILEVTEQENFRGAFIFRGVISDTFITLTSFKPRHTYHWRVQIQGDVDVWTAPYMFTVAETRIEAPVLVSPSDKENIADSSVLLKWTGVTNIEYYHIQTSKEKMFTTTSFDATITSETIKVKALENNESYFWRVRAFQSKDKKSTWSSVRQFSTQWKEPAPKPPGPNKDEKLRETYGTSDKMEIVKKALTRKNLKDAEYYLAKLPASPKNDSLSLELTWHQLNAGNLIAAKIILNRIDSKDSFSHLCQGRIFLKEKNYIAALNEFKNALRTKTIFNFKRVNMEVSWYFARANYDNYTSDKSAEKKQQALNAWEDVKKHYPKNSTNPRYKRALKIIDQLSKN